MMQSIKHPKAVFFDWDGTLVDSFAFLHETHNHVRGIFGLGAVTLDEFGAYFGKPREKLYAEIYGTERIEEAKSHFEAYVIANHDKILVIDGAEQILQTLCNAGIPMGVVTNKKGSLVRKEIEIHGWSDYFISIVGAGEADEDKPSSVPLLLAIEKSGLNITPADIWYVGDTDTDLQCGNGAGASCVLIENDEDKSDLITQYAPFLNFANCRLFADFLLQTVAKPLKQKENTA